MSTTPATNPLGQTWFGRLANLSTLALLILILVISTGEMVHGQLLKFGEVMFSDPGQKVQYFLLRADPEKPTCNRDVNVEQEVARQEAAAASGAPMNGTGQSDDVDDLFGERKFNAAAVRESLKATVANCVERHEMYEHVRDHITPSLKFYRGLETSFFVLFKFGADNRSMILLILLTVTAAFTTMGFHHISLRPARYARDFKAQAWSMTICSLMMLYSCVRYYQISVESGVAVEDPRVYFMWMVLFAVLAAVSAYRIVRPPQSHDNEQGTWARALECIPLIANLGIFSCVYFFMHGHPSGPAIYAHKILDFISIPLALALHIWAGMLFKQSRLVDLFMNIMRPWKLSPEALTYIILLAAGLPTAYAGVSSVFVIAAGAIIYHEVRAVGGSSQYALAATAMSGSLGVVLSPSLLVVGIAALNRQVTTAQLFYWGGFVFALTSTMFFIASQIHRHNRHQRAQVASPSVAIPAMLREMKVVIPYVVLVAAIAMFYSHVLDTPFNEISAPSILPVMMLLVLIFDKKMSAREESSRQFASVGAAAAKPARGASHAMAPGSEEAYQPAYAAQRQKTSLKAIDAATTETIEHVGSYISLMLFTQLIGGVVERSEVMSLAPQVFPNVWMAMGFLVVAKVILGMVMEPMGAILLVSSTLAPMAYANGIEPVHFWMMVLVAFELGYLLPPVAINQLLTRQVVGEAEIDKSDAEVAGQTFYRRYERWILPCIVMSISLGIVAFGPLLVQRVAFFQPIAKLFI
ncbi:MAG TPA: TRAP transporter large permease subunit [Aquabacterium sp.]|uniref:TRAP transporter large permease subunit n=1 Tax=Aquabacterium sp. TaxID=1872578 RepID=UPI002E310764|nr:TRAP transporter large permease subunit [Aquabacterium sp.]HEX5356118.1 TRAP transporter large permease subunit [Aquabacterium sp.]